MNNSQHDVDLCTAQTMGKHEQQLATLEKNLEKSQDIFRSGIGELKDDFKGLVGILGKTIDDNHRTQMAAIEKTEAKMDIMATKAQSLETRVAKLSERTQDNTDEITDIKRSIAWAVGGVATVGFGLLGWLLNQLYLNLGGH